MRIQTTTTCCRTLDYISAPAAYDVAWRYFHPDVLRRSLHVSHRAANHILDTIYDQQDKKGDVLVLYVDDVLVLKLDLETRRTGVSRRIDAHVLRPRLRLCDMVLHFLCVMSLTALVTVFTFVSAAPRRTWRYPAPLRLD